MFTLRLVSLDFKGLILRYVSIGQLPQFCIISNIIKSYSGCKSCIEQDWRKAHSSKVGYMLYKQKVSCSDPCIFR